MPWSRGAYARRPYAAGVGTEAAAPPGLQELPPPIPGGTNRWTYESSPVMAWAWRGWGGRVAPLTYPGGGVSILPDPERGVMTVSGWWPDAPVLQFVRRHRDGSIHPVRTASPLRVDQPTRRNLCQNPSFEAGLNGYVPDAGSPTLSTITDGSQGAKAIRATIASAGSCGLTLPVAMGGGKDVTMAMDLRFSARPTSVTFQITWVNAVGAPVAAPFVNLSSDDINRSVSQWARQVGFIPTPTGAATPTVKVIAAGLPAGATMDVDGVTVERDATTGSYFDGEAPGAVWTGVKYLSTSVLAPIMTFADGECPLDIPVSYYVANPAATGGRMVSAEATLDSNGKTWMTHPRAPSEPFVVTIHEVPKLTRKAVQGIFRTIENPYPLVVSQARRQSPEGSIQFWAQSWAERDFLLDVFDDMSPVLVREPGDFHSGPRWLSLGDMEEDPDGRPAPIDARAFIADFVEVAPPSELVA